LLIADREPFKVAAMSDLGGAAVADDHYVSLAYKGKARILRLPVAVARYPHYEQTAHEPFRVDH
jgi:hypothetical protein